MRYTYVVQTCSLYSVPSASYSSIFWRARACLAETFTVTLSCDLTCICTAISALWRHAGIPSKAHRLPVMSYGKELQSRDMPYIRSSRMLYNCTDGCLLWDHKFSGACQVLTLPTIVHSWLREISRLCTAQNAIVFTSKLCAMPRWPGTAHCYIVHLFLATLIPWHA